MLSKIKIKLFLKILQKNYEKKKRITDMRHSDEKYKQNASSESNQNSKTIVCDF